MQGVGGLEGSEQVRLGVFSWRTVIQNGGAMLGCGGRGRPRPRHRGGAPQASATAVPTSVPAWVGSPFGEGRAGVGALGLGASIWPRYPQVSL